MKIQFLHEGRRGHVGISCVPNDDPGSVGQPDEARGFPTCTATVEYQGAGYRAFFGWVQLVRSTDNATRGRAFEMDPFSLFEDAPSPYCFFGMTPTLFDAPFRTEKSRLEWVAHSFLGVTPLREDRRQVLPMIGFSWGFDIDDRASIEIKPVSELAAEDWKSHVPYFRERFPNWEFMEQPRRNREAPHASA